MNTYSDYQQTRIKSDAPGYRIATDAVAQRGLSLGEYVRERWGRR